MIYLISNLVDSGLPTAQIVAFVLGYIFAIIIGFGLHEFAHAFTAVKLGDPTPKAMGRLTLNPLKHLDVFGLVGFLVVGFGWAKPVAVNPLNFRKYKRDMFLVSVSGVITNIILAFIFSGAFYFFFTNCASFSLDGSFAYSNNLLYFFHYFFEYSIVLNIALFVFNLIPVYPLDGFNAIKSLTRMNNRFVDFAQKYGTIIMLVIIITPIFDIVYQNVTSYLTGIFFNFWGLFA